MTDDTPAEQDPTPRGHDDVVPETPEGATPYDGPDDADPEPFDGDATDVADFDPDHESTAPLDPETVVDPEPGDPVLDHDERPALDDGDPNPDDMAGDFTTPDVDLDFLPTDDGEDQP